MTSTTAVTDSTFEAEVLKAGVPVLVDFWAEWCGPCKALAPDLEKLAEELSGKVKIVKIDVTDSLETPAHYNIRSIPTLILFNQGQVVDRRVGGLPKDQLKQWIEKATSTA
jgi:thioredoxin 1